MVVITRNQRVFLKRSLPMLAAQRLEEGSARGAGLEVIVVDSGSTDGALDVVRAHSGAVRLVEIAPETFGFARAHNVGAAHARGEFVVRLSGDAIPARDDWLQRLLAPFAGDARLAATWGGQILPPHVRNPLERFAQRLLYPPSRPARRYTTPTTVNGANLAVRRSLLAAHPYDERLPQAEDYAWVAHWCRRGWTAAYVPDAPVIHGHEEPLVRAARRALAQSTFQGLIRLGVWGH